MSRICSGGGGGGGNGNGNGNGGGKRGLEVLVGMQRCCEYMQISQEEEEAAMGASSIPSTNEQVEEEDSEGTVCITTKAQDLTVHRSISLYESNFLPSSGGNAPSRDAATCRTAGKAGKCDGISLIRPRRKLEEDEDADDGCDKNAGCVTPKAHEHRIPWPLACPPPPHKKLKKKKQIRIDASTSDVATKPKGRTRNFYDYTTHNFFNPPQDLHTYPDCIRALFKS